MRVGVIVRMEADTDINEKFAEVRAMGMELSLIHISEPTRP